MGLVSFLKQRLAAHDKRLLDAALCEAAMQKEVDAYEGDAGPDGVSARPELATREAFERDIYLSGNAPGQPDRR